MTYTETVADDQAARDEYGDRIYDHTLSQVVHAVINHHNTQPGHDSTWKLCPAQPCRDVATATGDR